MDLDGDGRKDIITGSYPGDTYFFRNEGKGKFAAGKALRKASDGELMRYGPTSTASAADWNGDGHLDLILQAYNKMLFFPGTGTLTFAEPVPIVMDGKPFVLHDGVAHAVDWDGDGKTDIITGDFEGRIVFYRMIGIQEGVPQFGEPVVWVQPLARPGRALAENVRSSLFEFEDPAKLLLKDGRSGNRAKITVADWNNDGKMDLIVGDLLTCARPKRAFTEADRKHKEQLEQEREDLYPKRVQRYQALTEALYAEFGFKRETLTDEQREQLQAAQTKQAATDPEYTALSRRIEEIQKLLAEYSESPLSFGFVWVYLQR